MARGLRTAAAHNEVAAHNERGVMNMGFMDKLKAGSR
jgi:hypothetical protein